MPISVQVPPRIAANEIGISSFDEASPSCLARTMPTGTIIITSGVLLVKAESTATSASSIATAVRGKSFARWVTIRAKSSSRPVRTSAAETMNIPAMVSGAGLLSDASRSSAVRTPSASSSATAAMATTSGGLTSKAKASSRRTRTAATTSGR